MATLTRFQPAPLVLPCLGECINYNYDSRFGPHSGYRLPSWTRRYLFSSTIWLAVSSAAESDRRVPCLDSLFLFLNVLDGVVDSIAIRGWTCLFHGDSGQQNAGRAGHNYAVIAHPCSLGCPVCNSRYCWLEISDATRGVG